MENKTTTARVGAAYIRVSTGKQEELSPNSQKRLILDYAEGRGIVIPEEYIFMENGVSGRRADKRPKFQKMIAMAKAGRFEVILLWKFSRFARNQEESIVYKSMLRKSGVEVVSISEPLVDGPFGSLIERIIEWMDEFYSIRLSGDVTRGMTEKAMRGGYQSGPPLGYQIPYHNAKLQIVPEEAAIVRSIFQDYVNSRMSAFQIARKLNAEGFTTVRGKPFEKRAVEYILENPCYAGFVRWNRTEHATNTVKEADEWIIRPGGHEAIISREMFDAAQALKKSGRRPRRARPTGTYRHWLSGLLKCSSCGRTLAASSHKDKNGNTYYSFQCHGYGKGKCSVSHSVSERKLVPAVLEALSEVFVCCNTRFSAHRPDEGGGGEKNKLLLRQIERLRIKEARFRDAYAGGVDSLEEYKSNRASLSREREDLERQLTALRTRPAEGACRTVDAGALTDMLASDSFTVPEKCSAIQSIVDKIVFDRGQMQIDVYYRFVSQPTGLERH